jgi:hypothetical protein
LRGGFVLHGVASQAGTRPENLHLTTPKTDQAPIRALEIQAYRAASASVGIQNHGLILSLAERWEYKLI